MQERFSFWLEWLISRGTYEYIYFTLLGSVLALLFLLLNRYKKKELHLFKKDVICVFIVCLSLCTSYNALISTEQVTISDKLSIQLSPSIGFPTLVFLKILVSFWVVNIISCLLNIDKISESGLKLFGIEITNKMVRTGIDLDDLNRWIELLWEETEFIDYVHTQFLLFLERDSANQIEMAGNTPDGIRRVAQDFFNRLFYVRENPRYSIHVIPASEEGFSRLDTEIASIVRSFDNGHPYICGTHKNIGMVFLRSEVQELDTAIIIVASDNYELPRVEASAVGVIFASLAKASCIGTEGSN